MNRTMKRVFLRLALFAGVGAIVGTVSLLPLSLRLSPLTGLAAIVATVVVSIVWLRLIWRQFDEFEREAHKRAGLWGYTHGTLAGFLALGVATIFAIPPQLRFADVGAILHGQLPHQPLMLMMFGGLIVLLTACAGYLITLLIWRLRHSGDQHAAQLSE